MQAIWVKVPLEYLWWWLWRFWWQRPSGVEVVVVSMVLMVVNLRIAHLRIGYLVSNPEVGNPDPYQYSGLAMETSIITLF